MSGWIKIKEGDVAMIHHSTSSTIELHVEDKVIWMDYFQFAQLKRVLSTIEHLSNDTSK